MDTLLSPIMDDLRGCVCGALEDTLAGSVDCFCALMPGQEVPADWCSCRGRDKCGMAWVRLARLFPASAGFPNPDRVVRRGTAGGVALMAAVLEVGVYRCIPVPTGQGTPPGAVAQTNAALEATDDAFALATAIACCEPIQRRDHVLGDWTPRSAGDAGGGAWTVTVALSRHPRP